MYLPGKSLVGGLDGERAAFSLLTLRHPLCRALKQLNSVA